MGMKKLHFLLLLFFFAGRFFFIYMKRSSKEKKGEGVIDDHSSNVLKGSFYLKIFSDHWKV